MNMIFLTDFSNNGWNHTVKPFVTCKMLTGRSAVSWEWELEGWELSWKARSPSLAGSSCIVRAHRSTCLSAALHCSYSAQSDHTHLEYHRNPNQTSLFMSGCRIIQLHQIYAQCRWGNRLCCNTWGSHLQQLNLDILGPDDGVTQRQATIGCCGSFTKTSFRGSYGCLGGLCSFSFSLTWCWNPWIGQRCRHYSPMYSHYNPCPQ